MNEEKIKCPNCGYEIEMTEVLTHQIRESVKAEMEAKIRRREKQLEKQQAEIREKESRLDALVQGELKKKMDEIRRKEREHLREDFELEMKDLQEQLREKSGELKKARKMELQLRKMERELKEKETELDLELQKRVTEEMDAIKQETRKTLQESFEMKMKTQEKTIDDLKKALEEAKRRAEQGSVQTQGEVMEMSLEDLLKSAFRFDEIIPVPAGSRGADILQKVKNESLQACGKILWEAKNARNWSNRWLRKLKDDQAAAGAEAAVIVTETLPGGITDFGISDGILVTKKSYAVALAALLRESLIRLNYAQNAVVGLSEKMTMLYKYITGPEFRQKVEIIIEAFDGMLGQLEREKRAMLKLWKEREQQIRRVLENTAGMYGDFKGLIGSELSGMDMLELGSPEDEPKAGVKKK